MSTTLYLLRRQPESISPSLLQVSDTDKDVVLVEHVVATTLSLKGAVVDSEKMVVGDSPQTLTFDDLIEKIFSSAHVVVI